MKKRESGNEGELSPFGRQIRQGLTVVSSVMLCAILLLTRLPGMELLGIGPNWFLIWVVAWSVKRRVAQATVAGVALGFIQDGLTSFSFPSHAIALTLVGIVTSQLQKQRYIQEDFISIAIIVFMMAVTAETITAIGYSFQGIRPLTDIWTDYQQTALISAILSSLWAPVLYYPLNRWWEQLKS